MTAKSVSVHFLLKNTFHAFSEAPHSRHLGASEKSFSAENLTTLLDWNGVLRRIPQELLTPNREAFFAAVEKARKENTLAPLAPYRLREALEEVHSAEKIYRRYYQALLGKAL